MPHTGSISSCGASAAIGVAPSSSPRGPQLHELGQDRHRDVLVRQVTQVQARGRVHPRELLVGDAAVAKVPEHRLGALPRGHEPDVGCRRLERPPQRVLVVVALGRHDHERPVAHPGLREVERGHHARHAVVRLGVAVVIDHRGAPPERGRQLRERVHGGGAPDHDEVWCRQDGFHVDLQCAFALARDRHGHDAGARLSLELLGRTQEEHLRLAFVERLQRLADHGRLGARAAEPAVDPAVPRDQRGRAGLARRGRPAPDHGGEHERLALARERRRELEQLGLHAFTPSLSPPGSPPRPSPR
jgi:hypothetical protein